MIYKKRSILAALAITLSASSAFAGNDLPPPIEPIALGDTRLSCDALVVEAKNMQSVLGGAPQAGVFGNQRVMNVGEGLMREGIARSGIGGQAGAALGFLGRAAKAAGKRKAEAKAARKKSALRRWYYVVGLYQGKDCDNQPVQAIAPASVPAPAPAQEEAPVTTTSE